MEYNPIHLDIVWVLFATALVFLMQAGFAMLEAGATRAKNAANIIMKNVMDFSIGGIVYWAVGFGIAYGAAGAANEFFGAGNFFLNRFDDYPTWLFQFVFAATAATWTKASRAESPTQADSMPAASSRWALATDSARSRPRR